MYFPISLKTVMRLVCVLNSEISALWGKINNASDKKIFIQHIVLLKGFFFLLFFFFYQACMVLATSIEKREGKKKKEEGVEWPGFHTVGIDLA